MPRQIQYLNTPAALHNTHTHSYIFHFFYVSSRSRDLGHVHPLLICLINSGENNNQVAVPFQDHLPFV
uniref:Putative ovule protein n=1 Tax=Solanum chacoense TaxID=4108 RepID=A0A0V0HND5_SOLCH